MRSERGSEETRREETREETMATMKVCLFPVPFGASTWAVLDARSARRRVARYREVVWADADGSGWMAEQS